MSKVHIAVNQVPGYYTLNLQVYLNDRLDVQMGLHVVVPMLEQLTDEIREGFNVSSVYLDNFNTRIKIKCMRTELRKIETWLVLQGYELQPLKRWKNEKT